MERGQITVSLKQMLEEERTMVTKEMKDMFQSL